MYNAACFDQWNHDDAISNEIVTIAMISKDWTWLVSMDCPGNGNS